MDIEQVVAAFIENQLVVDPEPVTLAVDTPLFQGLLDSLSMLRLVVFIEEHFHIRVEEDEAIPENFQTVQRIAQYIQHKRAAGV